MARRYPLVRQQDDSDCGAAVLATIARYYNVQVPLREARALAATDYGGTTLRGLLGAAPRLGFVARGMKGPYAALAGVALPAIVQWHRHGSLGHFVVLYRVTQRRVIVGDPEHGVRALSPEEFCRQWTGVVILVAPAPDRRGSSAPSPRRPLARLVTLLGGHRRILIEALACTLALTALGFGSGLFVQYLIDSVLVHGERDLLNMLGLGMLLVVLVRLALSVVRRYLLAVISRRVDLSLASDFARTILQLPMRHFETRRVGEVLSRINDVSRVRQAISGTTLTVAVDSVLIVACATVLWVYDPRLAALATGFVIVMMFVGAAHHREAERRSRAAIETAAARDSHLIEDICGMETIKTLGIQPQRFAEGEQRIARAAQANYALDKVGISLAGIGFVTTELAALSVLWYGGHRVMAGALTVGELMFFATVLGFMLGPVERLAALHTMIEDALVAVDRLFEVLDEEPEPSGTASVPFERVRDEIAIDGVHFAYPNRAKVLDSITLRIPAGSTVAIVGASGSGKSTLLKLLLRLDDPSMGRIAIDGVDLRDYDLHTLRSRVGFVSQDLFVFNGTLRENIACSRPDAPMDDVAEAARVALLDELVASLPRGYDTVIGERGANLSGGQRQRLAIARAIVRKPGLLIFDEATSHLDADTERSIQHRLRDTLTERTVVLVTHRLTTAMSADWIYVLNGGRMVQEGTYGDLVDADGPFRTMWEAQTMRPLDLPAWTRTAHPMRVEASAV